MKITHLVLALIFIGPSLIAQKPLTSAMLEQQAIRFTLDDQNNLDTNTRRQWLSWVGNHQFVGIAEVHHSRQLSSFTTAILPLLSERGYEFFALEISPNAAIKLSNLTKVPELFSEKIKKVNHQYGKRFGTKTPLVFVDKKSDALFITKAAEEGFIFWGLDQEYSYSFEMLIDELHTLDHNPSAERIELYKEVKQLIRKKMFKGKVDGKHVSCWYDSNTEINNYFKGFGNNQEAMNIISSMKESWDIYCKSVSGRNSNQQRADLMKRNCIEYFSAAGTKDPKVFLKFGSVHLTHGLSPFGVDDMGKFLHERSNNDSTGFLSIRYLISHTNGRSNLGRPGWSRTSMFLELGRKDQWTAVDLRPFRAQLKKGLITADENMTFELMSYDILLLSPNDRYAKTNF